MRAQIAYGRGRLTVALPAGARALRCRPVAPVADPAAAVLRALREPIGAPPLRQLAAGRRSACIVVSDVTRPVPCRTLLPPLLAELEGAVAQVELLVATGTHRASTPAEKREMFGADVVERYRIVDHDSRDPSAVVALDGRTSSGTRPRVSRRYVKADLKILTGLVEPHFMAGYSGGRKAVFPGLTDLRSVRQFHGPRFLEHPLASSGVLAGNPCHREAAEAARLAGADFIVNVALDLERRIVGVFAGELDGAFDAAVAKVDSFCRAEADAPADIVVTSGGGHPLDATFYQSVKGMVSALPVVREGGTILIASACSEGIGNPEYAELRVRYDGRHEQLVPDILRRDDVEQDQWEFEEQCKVLRRVGVGGLVVSTDGIPLDTLRRLSVTPAQVLCEAADPAARLQGALDSLLARQPGARVIAIPDGPYVLAGPRATRG